MRSSGSPSSLGCNLWNQALLQVACRPCHPAGPWRRQGLRTPRLIRKAFVRRWQFPSDLAPAVCAPASCLWHLTFLSFPLPWKGLSRKSALPSSCLSVIDLVTRLSEVSACLPPRHPAPISGLMKSWASSGFARLFFSCPTADDDN